MFNNQEKYLKEPEFCKNLLFANFFYVFWISATASIFLRIITSWKGQKHRQKICVPQEKSDMRLDALTLELDGALTLDNWSNRPAPPWVMTGDAGREGRNPTIDITIMYCT